MNLHIIGITESHLVNNNIIDIENYKWFGNNRSQIHTRAKTGSGGVGLLVKDEVAKEMNISIEDATTDGIIWIKFSEKTSSDNQFYVCVTYLPPEFSARSTNVHDFFDSLMSQIYSIPNGNPFYICGDFNSRIGEMEDFIPGVDELPEREVIDYKSNCYGEIFCEFLSNVNCCVLNGRNSLENDFTYVSTRGLSVVDYCVLPYENLNIYKNFEVIRASELANKSIIAGSIEPRFIPDHSVLKWEMEIALCEKKDIENVYKNKNVQKRVIYNVKNIPNNWLQDENVIGQINSCIVNIENSYDNQIDIDNVYNEFINIMQTEMNDKLEQKTKLLDGCNNKRRRFKKPWWSDELTLKWNETCLAESQYLKCTVSGNKTVLRTLYLNKRKDFDKLVQQRKRMHWRQSQDELLQMNNKDSKQFWRKIGNIGIGNERQSSIPNEVALPDGTITNNIDSVLNTWKNSFCNLLNQNSTNELYTNVNLNVESNIECDFLDKSIIFEEVYNVVMNAKNGKCAGIDLIQVELCKNYTVINILTKLFDLCFKTGKIPKIWNKGIITPIPKCSSSDPRDPLSYRGITLTPCAYKLYCSVLNNRLVKWLEEREIINDEQNGFIKGRSTIDHVSTLTSIIETRKKCKLSTFVSFIDFKKAYDSIDRSLLFNKLNDLGLSTKFLFALKAIYSNVECCVRLNGNTTDWFNVNTGLKQGCVLSTVMFNIFINNLITDVKELDIGIDIDGQKVAILLYADDLILMSENKEDMQRLLDVLGVWCNNNCLNVNFGKSKMIHFRNQSISRSDCIFKINGENIEYVSSYQYLGLVLNEFLDYNVMAKAVAKSASRALGLLIVKCKTYGGFQHNIFTKLFDTLVWSVINYGSAIWGTKEFSCISAVQNRAMRFYMGVGKYTPNDAVAGDMGWKPSYVRQWVNVFRHWSRCSKMDVDRINYKVFKWSIRKGSYRIKNWSYQVMEMLKFYNMEQFCNMEVNVLDKNTICQLEEKMFDKYKNDWCNRMNQYGQGDKLRTYKLFKYSYSTEQYLLQNIPLRFRSAFAKFRCGVAPLKIMRG